MNSTKKGPPLPPRRKPLPYTQGYRRSTRDTTRFKWITGGIILFALLLAVGSALYVGSKPSENVSATSVPDAGATRAKTSFMQTQARQATPLTTTAVLKPTETATFIIVPPDIPYLQKYMLDLINDDRRTKGIPPLQWSASAAQAGLSHANEMASFSYENSFNLDGFDPAYRYSGIQGYSFVQESVYAKPLTDDLETSTEWKNSVQKIYSLMLNNKKNSENLFASEHTHVGVGISFNPMTKWLAVTQEFINQYVLFDQSFFSYQGSENIFFSGKVILQSIQLTKVDTLYEPMSNKLSIAQLTASVAIQRPLRLIQTLPISQTPDGRFEVNVNLGDQPAVGLYHIRFSALTLGKVDAESQEILVNEIILPVK